MSLMPDVPGLERYEREVEAADRAAEAAAEGKLEALEWEDSLAEIEYDRDEDCLRERAYIESRGEQW